MQYPWAVNQTKLNVAIGALRSAGADITEETVRAEYIKRGGLIKEVVAPTVEAPEPEPAGDLPSETPTVPAVTPGPAVPDAPTTESAPVPTTVVADDGARGATEPEISQPAA